MPPAPGAATVRITGATRERNDAVACIRHPVLAALQPRGRALCFGRVPVYA